MSYAERLLYNGITTQTVCLLRSCVKYAFSLLKSRYLGIILVVCECIVHASRGWNSITSFHMAFIDPASPTAGQLLNLRQSSLCFLKDPTVTANVHVVLSIYMKFPISVFTTKELR